ncbi:hypothetical protein Ddye_017899 [Dipteronia dyeriana]|uniref:Cytochrome b561 domain-containing protein n=1 Tax=Dipteronia dyeriana TaxID=168575 RepID=A0AAD9UAJ2_9ROSI|nr:hypothetical protein Ddye_017899 [Dipteronia dyeriana]
MRSCRPRHSAPLLPSYHCHRNREPTPSCSILIFMGFCEFGNFVSNRCDNCKVFKLFLGPKDHKYRFYWNIYHHGIGFSILIMGIVNVFKGLDILNPGKKWKTANIINHPSQDTAYGRRIYQDGAAIVG